VTVFVCRLPVDETLTIDGAMYAGAAGDFTTLSLLGEGVRGTVYKCRHRPSSCTLAVKVSHSMPHALICQAMSYYSSSFPDQMLNEQT